MKAVQEERRTSVMVGFPGETDADFLELKSFVEKMRFDHLGCFIYSQEEGTQAARMSDQLDEKIKLERQEQIMELQQRISSDRLKSYVGKVLPVLVEGLSDETDFRVVCHSGA